MSTLIGRKKEVEELSKSLKTESSELVILYGRRRVGKTYLVRQFYKNKIVFEITGLYKGGLKDQLKIFHKELAQKNPSKKLDFPNNWLDAFALLENHLNTLKTKKKKVIFFDEFPWIATHKSKFLMAFENFWNHYCTQRNDLIVVLCGSAASYMVKKVVKNKGGLHNRLTRKIRLLPFNISETKQFLKSKGIDYTDFDIVQLYMCIGGIPHYLEKLDKGLSVAQNIDKLCFSDSSFFRNEFEELFSSLFENSELHTLIVKTLATVNKGITRKELVQKTGIPSGGDLTNKLFELVESGFVSNYPYYKNKKHLMLYRLSDEYSKFYLKFIDKNKHNGEGTWQRLSTTQSYKSWCGFAFEQLCLKHIHEIKKALKIDAIYSINSSWFNKNAQIDLLIDRDDNVMNICEIKFYNSPFSIDKKYYLELKNKIAEFKEESQTNKNIFLTCITTHGVKENSFSREIINNNLKINILFSI